VFTFALLHLSLLLLLLLLQLHIMLDLKGHLKLCHPMEALASEQQRHIFRDEMIPGGGRGSALCLHCVCVSVHCVSPWADM
jgi:hypothetical protein